jgi:hypothetical protein
MVEEKIIRIVPLDPIVVVLAAALAVAEVVVLPLVEEN